MRSSAALHFCHKGRSVPFWVQKATRRGNRQIFKIYVIGGADSLIWAPSESFAFAWGTLLEGDMPENFFAMHFI